MSIDVLCLRPEADFTRVGVTPPKNINIAYRKPDDAVVPALMKEARAVVRPAVGPKHRVLHPCLDPEGIQRIAQLKGNRLKGCARDVPAIAVRRQPDDGRPGGGVPMRQT